MLFLLFLCLLFFSLEVAAAPFLAAALLRAEAATATLSAALCVVIADRPTPGV